MESTKGNPLFGVTKDGSSIIDKMPLDDIESIRKVLHANLGVPSSYIDTPIIKSRLTMYIGTGRADGSFTDPVEDFVDYNVTVQNIIDNQIGPAIDYYSTYKLNVMEDVKNGFVILEDGNPYKSELKDLNVSLSEIVRLTNYIKSKRVTLDEISSEIQELEKTTSAHKDFSKKS